MKKLKQKVNQVENIFHFVYLEVLVCVTLESQHILNIHRKGKTYIKHKFT